MRKILVLGASGQLGKRLVADIDNCVGTYRSQNTNKELNYFYLDVSDFVGFEKLVDENNPDVIINCIGLTNVDECEKLPEKNWLINCKFPVDIAKFCQSKNIKFIQISTDHYEISGSKKITETSSLGSPNQYSFAKLSAEKMILDLDSSAMILRANFFQFQDENSKVFIDKMVEEVKRKHLIKSFKDVYFTPISIASLIKYILKLLEVNFSGILNISVDQVVSKFDFHELILSSFHLDKSFHEQISIKDINLPARRSSYMGLDNGKLKNLLGIASISIYDIIEEEKIYQNRRDNIVKE